MLKKRSILFLVFTMILAFTACSSDVADDEADENGSIEELESTDVVDGGWTISENKAAALPEEVQAAFDKAYEQFTGSDLKPVAYIASQVVAGTNYTLLCKITPVTPGAASHYAVVTVYENAGGNAEISDTFIRHPAERLSVGDVGQVVVLDVDEKKGRISLSIKQAAANKQA